MEYEWIEPIVVSGPSQAGKTKLVSRMCEQDRFDRVVTATTRQPREGERHGVDYFFMNEDIFKENIETGRFFEYTRTHDEVDEGGNIVKPGNFYGTPVDSIDAVLEKGSMPLWILDVDGVEDVTAKLKQREYITKNGVYVSGIVSVFLHPSNDFAYYRRIWENISCPEKRRNRVATSRKEMAQLYLSELYDYRVDTHEDIEDSFRSLAGVAIYIIMKQREAGAAYRQLVGVGFQKENFRRTAKLCLRGLDFDKEKLWKVGKLDYDLDANDIEHF